MLVGIASFGELAAPGGTVTGTRPTDVVGHAHKLENLHLSAGIAVAKRQS